MNLLHSTLADLSRALDAREFSSEELTRAYLDRIERFNSGVNAYIDVYPEEALKAARQSDRERAAGETRGPLHGMPLALKDIIDLKGRPTTAGSVLLPGTPAKSDAEVSLRLRAAGAVFLGKLNLHEFAWGGTTRNVHFGDASNPWRDGYSPGGSSGGSAAATVAGLAAGTLGTDTLGSVRIPASYCGCVGLKTTYGRVSNRGVYPLAWSLDTVGPIARSTEDAGMIFDVIAGPDPEEPTSAPWPYEIVPWESEPSIRGLKLGVVRHDALTHDGSAEEREVSECVGRALDHLQSLGAEPIEIDMPEWNEARSVVMKIAMAEASALHAQHIEKDADRIGEDVRQRLEIGRNFSGTDIAFAYRRAVEIRHRAGIATRDVDALIFPTTATVSHPFDPKLAIKTAKFTGPVNLMGWPAVSVPCGFTDAGLPVGLQIVTRGFEERLALRIARAYEASTSGADAVPPGFD